MKIDHELNATGLACPLPIVRAKKAMEQLTTGQVLQVTTTDAGSKADLTAWTKSQGHELLDLIEENATFIFIIKKK